MNGPSVMIWGCITAAGVGKLAIVEGTMNAAKYRTTLDENLLPSIEKCYGEKMHPSSSSMIMSRYMLRDTHPAS